MFNGLKKIIFFFFIFNTIILLPNPKLNELPANGAESFLSAQNKYLNWKAYLTFNNSSYQINFKFKLKAGYHINSNTPTSENFIPTTFNLDKEKIKDNKLDSANSYLLRPLSTNYPTPTLSTYYKQELSVYEADDWKTITLDFELERKAKVDELSIPFLFSYQPCDENLCFPPEAISDQLEINYAALVQLTKPSSFNWSWLGLMVAAWLGGLLLNFMPCVLPILSLKAYAFINQNLNPNNLEKTKQRKYSVLSFIVGSWLSFFSLGVVLIIIRSFNQTVNWGLQFQNPFFLLTLIIIFWILSLALLGAFELQFRFNFHFSSSKQNVSYAMENFISGFFLSLFSTSCTAPFLGIAVGYALTQTNFTVIVIFNLIGLGFITPYFFLLSQLSLKWFNKFFPKPGEWTIYFKKFSALPIFLIIVWIINVLETILFFEIIVWLMTYLVIISFAFYFWGIIQRKKPNLNQGKKLSARSYFFYKISFFSLIILSTFLIYFSVSKASSEKNLISNISQGQTSKINFPTKAAGLNNSFEKKFKENLQEGNIFFVHYTAKWCINCQVNRIALDSNKVKKFFKENKINYLVADWTKPNQFIAQKIREEKRGGIPLDVFYRFHQGKLFSYPLPTFFSGEKIKETFFKFQKEK